MIPQSFGWLSAIGGDESITDPETLRDRPDVPVHRATARVDEETCELVADLGDVAPVGVTNADGEVLLWRLTPDSAWTLPIATVCPGADFAAAARTVVERYVGLAVDLDGVETAWWYEAWEEGGGRVATRRFVVFGASPAADGSHDDLPTADVTDEDRPTAVGWFDALPDDAVRAPGARLFFD